MVILRDMKSELKVLGVVGIRSGSRGVPDKNIRLLNGKPLVGWILEEAKKSKYINRLIVSTDSPEYAELAKKIGAEAPYLRPKELAQDKSADFEYVKHAIGWLAANENYRPDIVVRMMATAPFQKIEDIDACIEELIKDSKADSAVVIAEARQHPGKALKLVDGGNGEQRLVSYITGKSRDANPTARQSYEKAYFRANVVASRIATISEGGTLTGDYIRYHIIPQERAIDIDSEIDFFIAEQLMRLNGEKNG